MSPTDKNTKNPPTPAATPSSARKTRSGGVAMSAVNQYFSLGKTRSASSRSSSSSHPPKPGFVSRISISQKKRWERQAEREAADAAAKKVPTPSKHQNSHPETPPTPRFSNVAEAKPHADDAMTHAADAKPHAPSPPSVKRVAYAKPHAADANPHAADAKSHATPDAKLTSPMPKLRPTLTFGSKEDCCLSDGSEPKDHRRNPHGKDSHIRPGSTVRGYFDIKKKGKRPIRVKRSATVIEGVGRNKWLVKYGDDKSQCAVKHSNSLTLVPGQQCPDLVVRHDAGYGSDSDSDDDAIYDDAKPDSNGGYLLSYSSDESDDETDDDDCGDVTSSGVSAVSKSSSKKRKGTKTMASEKKRNKKEVDSQIEDDDDVIKKEEKEDRKIRQKIDRHQRRIDESAGLQITCIAGTNKDPTKKPDPNEIMTWELQRSHVPDEGNPAKRKAGRLGIKSQGLLRMLKEHRVELPLAELFMQLSVPNGDPQPLVDKMNEHVQQDYGPFKQNDSDVDSPLSAVSPARSVKLFELHEWYIFQALVIGAADTNERGVNLWQMKRRKESASPKNPHDLREEWLSIIPHSVNYTPFMTLTRFKEFKRYYAMAWENEDLHEKGDAWWQILDMFDMFNKIRKDFLLTSETRTIDELMSSYLPRTTKNGGMPHLSKVQRKPKDIGGELRAAVCHALGVSTFLLPNRGGDGNQWFFKKNYGGMNVTSGTTLHMANGMCQSSEDNVTETIVADAWFGNINSARALLKNPAPGGFRRHFIFNVKGKARLIPMDTIQELLSEAPGGCHVVFKGKDPVTGKELLAIGWKYNKEKIMCFLADTGAGSSTESVRPYHQRHVDSQDNVRFRVLPRPHLVEKYYSVNNSVDCHNNLRQNFLALEEHWVTTNGICRLQTTLTGMTVIDVYKLCKYHGLFGPLHDMGPAGGPVGIRKFAGVLSKQLLFMADSKRNTRALIPNQVILKNNQHMTVANRQLSNEMHLETCCSAVVVKEESVAVTTSASRNNKHTATGTKNDVIVLDGADSSSSSNISRLMSNHNYIGGIEDRLGQMHNMMKYPKKEQECNGKTYRGTRSCSFCFTGQSRVYCVECNLTFCYPLRESASMKEKGLTLREAQEMSCFETHVRNVRRKGDRSTKTHYIFEI